MSIPQLILGAGTNASQTQHNTSTGGWTHALLVRSALADPTTTDIPAGEWVLWKNTTNGEVRIWHNDGGTLVKTNVITSTGEAGGAGEANTIALMVYFSKAKTNIGTAYVDIYNTLEPDELFNVVDFTNFVDFRIVFIWDYVGAGTQQVRWVDRANNANVLWESATFTADRDGTDSGWIVLPAWATGEKQIEWQGKSTTGTDDPVAKGFILLLR